MWEARRDVHEGYVPGQWERKVMAISQLEHGTCGEQAGYKDGERSYQVQRLPAHSLSF